MSKTIGSTVIIHELPSLEPSSLGTPAEQTPSKNSFKNLVSLSTYLVAIFINPNLIFIVSALR